MKASLLEKVFRHLLARFCRCLYECEGKEDLLLRLSSWYNTEARRCYSLWLDPEGPMAAGTAVQQELHLKLRRWVGGRTCGEEGLWSGCLKLGPALRCLNVVPRILHNCETCSVPAATPSW